MRQDESETRRERIKDDDEIKYSKMHFIVMKHWWDKNTSEQKKDETQFNIMMHRRNWNKSESHLNQIWTRWDEIHFNMMMHEWN